MSKLDDIKAEVAEIRSSAENISADLDRLAQQITGGLSAQEADQVVADLSELSSQLKAIADRNPESDSTTSTTTL